MNILVFTGAGFCHPLNLPMTSGFKKLIEGIKGNLSSNLSEFLGNNQFDVEHVLSTLESFIKSDNFAQFIIEKSNTYNYISGSSSTKVEFATLKTHAEDSIIKIKKSIYSLLSDFKTEDAEKLYGNLISQIRAKYIDPKISFFTTNYDLTFESAIEGINLENIEYDFGFTIKNSKQSFDSKKSSDWNSGIIEYKKLHGSLDWTVDNKGKYTRSGTAIPEPDNPNRMPLLYPGYKDTPTQEPFKTMHDQLLSRLLTADVVIVIGFAFRDNYINNMFDTALRINEKVSVLCFNPCETKLLPSESGIHSFINNYSQFKYIKKGVSLDKDPLDFEETYTSIKALRKNHI